MQTCTQCKHQFPTPTSYPVFCPQCGAPAHNLTFTNIPYSPYLGMAKQTAQGTAIKTPQPFPLEEECGQILREAQARVKVLVKTQPKYLEQRYDAVQEALGRLFDAMGGRQMTPGRLAYPSTRDAMASVIAHLILLIPAPESTDKADEDA